MKANVKFMMVVVYVNDGSNSVWWLKFPENKLNQTRNACHGSANQADYAREAELFFGKNFAPTAAFNNNTCCIIKPHIVQEGRAG